MAASFEPPSDLDDTDFPTQIGSTVEGPHWDDDRAQRRAIGLSTVVSVTIASCLCLLGVAALAYGVTLLEKTRESQSVLSLWEQGRATEMALTAKGTSTAEAVREIDVPTATARPARSTPASLPDTPGIKSGAHADGIEHSSLGQAQAQDLDVTIDFQSYDTVGGLVVFRITNVSDGPALESATVRIQNRDTEAVYYGPLHSNGPFYPEALSGASESNLAPGATKYMRYKLTGNPAGVPCEATITLHTTDGGSGARLTEKVDFTLPVQTARAIPENLIKSGGLDSGQCAAIPGVSYTATWVEAPPTDRPAEDHPDLNLSIRGFAPTNERRSLVFYHGDTDTRAVQLSGLLGDDRQAVISAVYQVRDWDWDRHRRGGLLQDPEVSLIGLRVSPGDIVYLPPSGRTIGEGFDALLLYADPVRITLKYARDDTVAGGYTVHLDGVCPEPRLLALYRECNSRGRRRLPALRPGHALGRATSSELLVAIRDNGDFMDPRSSKDWWRK